MIIKATYDITTNKIDVQMSVPLDKFIATKWNEERIRGCRLLGQRLFCSRSHLRERERKNRLNIFLPFYSIPWGLFSLGPWKSTFPTADSAWCSSRGCRFTIICGIIYKYTQMQFFFSCSVSLLSYEGLILYNQNTRT